MQDIVPYLNGATNPYDVAALLTVMRKRETEPHVNSSVNFGKLFPKTVNVWMHGDFKSQDDIRHIKELQHTITNELKAACSWVVSIDEGPLPNRIN